VIDVNSTATTKKWTPLHVAAMRGFDKAIKELISNGADSNLVNVDGQTALHIAVERRRKRAVRALLANVDAKSIADKRDDYGISAVDIASHKGKHSMHSLILNSAYKQYQQKPLPVEKTRKTKNVWNSHILDELESEFAINALYEKDLFDDEDDDIIGY
jgi:ankyrin repeat protein